ncbi:alkaline phosphatase D family protein [Modestobacter sp. VKM Ac-2978]|uniref:alkaline phosphatase D family protein n=1 Tax=Modestobacter sp. VKM Ac-2978 TaxID=3004132 RepID=UPI0022AA7271|nr:alkaline phosphatase D family protein [Modestobacter sp. VKM Ac-2978]MCZ2849776.1 alkaline phosphatase D family protein [Modestobacter sp. VKM Ac-2978]
MNRRRVKEDWWADADVDRAQIFVPAIMGVGVLVSAVTLLRDALHGRHRRGQDRRTTLEARAAAQFAVTGAAPDRALLAGLRPRVHYLLLALTTGALAAYGARGATKNYAQPAGLFGGEIGWLYATLLLAAAAIAAVAVASAVLAVTWPEPPRVLRPLLARTPLGQVPQPAGGERRRLAVLLLGWAAVLTGAASAQFLFTTAGAPQLLGEFDDEVTGASGTALRWELLGQVPVAVTVAALLALLAMRCPPLALGQLAVVLGSLVLTGWFTDVVERAHPPDGPLAGLTDSLPSGPVLQATLIAGFLPLAVFVRTRRRRPALITLAVTGTALLVVAVGTVRARVSWPSDVVAGALVGLALVLATWWALEHRRLHERCDGCPWAPADRADRLGLLPLDPSLLAGIRRASRLGLAAVLVVLAGLAAVEGLPVSPEGEAMGPTTSRTVQLTLLGLVALAWLVALRWEATGAALVAVTGLALAVFAAVAYQPWVSVLIAGAFLAPAVGLWLHWQHRRTMRSVTVLAVVTATLLAGTYTAGAAVHDRLYGPAAPLSGQVALPVDLVEWVWTGGVTDRSARAVAQAGPGSEVRWLVTGPDGAQHRSPAVTTADDGVARLAVAGLTPATRYAFAVEVDGVADRARGVGGFSTVPDGPASFTLAVGGCARTGSSSAVFDAIRAVDPLLYLQTGDLHYGNVTRTDVGVFGDRYADTLSAPAQAALYRQVPVAYTWGDHDYGGNDSDATSPVRSTARAAYRSHVPAHPLVEGHGGAIYQSFDVGRVRVLLTDTRSERTEDSMLGARQLAWLQEELVRGSREAGLVVWVNPDPWVAPAEPGRDDWGGFAAERREIADVIAAHGIEDLVMVSGDAHMVAVDDGTNTDYSTGGGAGFPLLHAAALDRPGSVKGGPYSEGTFPGAGQFGTVDVEDDGGPTIGVELTGRRWDGEVLVSWSTTVAVD